MEKNTIFLSTKQAMIQKIEEMNLKTLASDKGHILNYFDFLSILDTLPIPDKEIIETNFEENINNDLLETTTESNEVVQMAYSFERGIKGGFLPEINAFVPERIVRELSLQNGDLVFATPLEEETNKPGPKRYQFEVAEYLSEALPTNRHQIDFAIIEYDKTLSLYIAKRTIDGKLIKVDDYIQSIVISDKDVTDLQIGDGDIVDLAYTDKTKDSIRVIWRYSIGKKNDILEESKPTKKKNTKQKKEYPQTLLNKKIAMMGFEPGKPAMQEEVEKRGGELIWISGKEDYTRIYSSIKKSDCFIGMLEFVSHRGTISGYEIAKELEVPYSSLHSIGRSSFISEVCKLLNIKE